MRPFTSTISLDEARRRLDSSVRPIDRTEAVAHLHREWGGEFAMRRYYTTAAAKMLTERFGADLGKFLSVVDKADPADLIDLLRESVGCRQATSDAPERLQTDDEPTLPFMDAVQSTGGSVPHC